MIHQMMVNKAKQTRDVAGGGGGGGGVNREKESRGRKQKREVKRAGGKQKRELYVKRDRGLKERKRTVSTPWVPQCQDPRTLSAAPNPHTQWAESERYRSAL